MCGAWMGQGGWKVIGGGRVCTSGVHCAWGRGGGVWRVEE